MTLDNNFLENILDLTLVDVDAIRACRFRIYVDVTNADDCHLLIKMFNQLGVDYVILEDEKNIVFSTMEKSGFFLGIMIGAEADCLTLSSEYGYDSDALVGIALSLSRLAQRKRTVNEQRSSFAEYHIIKNQIDITPNINIDILLNKVKDRFAHDDSAHISDADGLKIDYPDRWVYLCKSSSQSVIRVYSEAPTMQQADDLANQMLQFVYNVLKDIYQSRTIMAYSYL